MGKKNRRGIAGAEALIKQKEEKTKDNIKRLKKTLNYFRDNKIPLSQKVIADKSGISVSTLNRNPYKGIYNEYVDFEKVMFSPNGKHEINNLIKKIDTLEKENKELKEKYIRLKKELTFIKELKFIE